MVEPFIEISKHSTVTITLTEHLGATLSSKAWRTSFLILTLTSWDKFFIPILLETPEYLEVK